MLLKYARCDTQAKREIFNNLSSITNNDLSSIAAINDVRKKMKSELLRQSYNADQLICRSVNQIKSSHNIAVPQCILFSRYRSRPMLCANLHKWGLTNHLPVILASDRP